MFFLPTSWDPWKAYSHTDTHLEVGGEEEEGIRENVPG